MGKVVSQDRLIVHRQAWKGNGKRVVFVAGCFDLLHPGHIRLLEQARAYGDIVVVGVLNDTSARAAYAQVAREPSIVRRPITPGDERSEVLAALSAVDYVFEFDASALPGLLARLQPDIAVEGAEPSPLVSLSPATVKGAGSQFVRVPIEPGHSTLRLVERITQLRA